MLVLGSRVSKINRLAGMDGGQGKWEMVGVEEAGFSIVEFIFINLYGKFFSNFIDFLI
jgi:hypothetical protein